MIITIITMNIAAAAAMIYAIDDPWSYYVPVSSMTEFESQHTNSYVGIGVTVIILMCVALLYVL